MFVEVLQYHKRNVDNLFLLENTEVSTEPGANSPHHPVTLEHVKASEHTLLVFPAFLQLAWVIQGKATILVPQLPTLYHLILQQKLSPAQTWSKSLAGLSSVLLVASGQNQSS